ncbi:hypothetical protein D5086_002672 [Populus alba]|uniref:Uncharacterized protein n=1 Tax=Populus alba TaxID=43335 RepID=A0ACC4D424_POPAL
MRSKAGRAMPVEVIRIAEFSCFLTMGSVLSHTWSQVSSTMDDGGDFDGIERGLGKNGIRLPTIEEDGRGYI